MTNEFKPASEYCVGNDVINTENWNHEFITRLVREALNARYNKTAEAVYRAEKSLQKAKQTHFECIYRMNNPA